MVYKANITVEVCADSEEDAIDQIEHAYRVSSANIEIEEGKPTEDIEPPYITVQYNKQRRNQFGGTVSVEEEEKTEWKVPFNVAVEESGTFPESNSHASDRLLYTSRAPLSLKRRGGPFSITIKKLVIPEEYDKGNLEETTRELFEQETEVREELDWEDYIPSVDIVTS
jgi:hypothetical protein